MFLIRATQYLFRSVKKTRNSEGSKTGKIGKLTNGKLIISFLDLLIFTKLMQIRF